MVLCSSNLILRFYVAEPEALKDETENLKSILGGIKSHGFIDYSNILLIIFVSILKF